MAQADIEKAASLLKEMQDLQAKTEKQAKIIKRLHDEIESATHRNRGTSPDRAERGISVRWELDSMAECINILVKAGPYRGIILEVPEAALFDRDSTRALFPRYMVRGNMQAQEKR